MPNVLIPILTEEEKEKARREQLQSFINMENPLLDRAFAPLRNAAGVGSDILSRLLPSPDVQLESVAPSNLSQAAKRIRANRTLNPSATGISQDMQIRQALKGGLTQAGQVEQQGGDDLLRKKDRLTALGSGPNTVAEDVAAEFASLAGGVNPDSITTPEETMINTHMDNQRGIIAGNNAARESRRSYIPDAASEKRNTASRLRNKLTGQVDEMSSLGGGRGQMLMALADRDRVDLSTPEGRRAAFGAAPTTDPSKAGPVVGDRSGKTQLTADQLRGVAPGSKISSRTGRVISGVGSDQRQRKLARKTAVSDYDATRRSAAAAGVQAATDGTDIKDVLRGLPASAKRGAQRAHGTALRGLMEAEAIANIEQAKQPQPQQLPQLDPAALERTELMSLLQTGQLSDEEKREVIRRILGGTSYGSIDDPNSGSSYAPPFQTPGRRTSPLM